MITKEQFTTIEALFDYYNHELFKGKLNDCMLNLSRKNGSMGFMAPKRWRDANGNAIHEISINPDTFNIDDEEFHRTLVHEMCHLWQQDFGDPPRRCYHDKQWANKMIMVGLMPSHNGQIGGKITGQQMNDYTIQDGRFIKSFNAIQKEKGKLKLPYCPINYQKLDRKTVRHIEREDMEVVKIENAAEDVPISKDGVKFKYTCNCGCNVWGKFGLKILCLDCNSDFIIQ